MRADATLRGDRLTADVVADAERRYNPLGEYEIDLRGLRIGRLENLATARDQYDAYDFTDNDVVRLENLPSMPRCKTLMFGNNRIARVNGEELARATPALTTLTLTNNALRNLGDCDALGALKKLKMLTLCGNPVCAKENYRLYVIYKCKALKTLDFQKVRASEREEAEKTFGADDGAAQRAKTFTPGDGLEETKDETKKDAKPSGPTPEQLTALKVAIANAETLEEVSRLENALKSGVVPSDLRI